jgi:hypothetical protein
MMMCAAIVIFAAARVHEEGRYMRVDRAESMSVERFQRGRGPQQLHDRTGSAVAADTVPGLDIPDAFAARASTST